MAVPGFQNLFPTSGDVSAADLADARRWLTLNGIGTQMMETLTWGALLTAFALSLGASNAFIGLLAAAPHLANLGQLVGVSLVERVRRRRLIAVVAGCVGRPLLLCLCVAAYLPDQNLALGLILIAILARYFMGAIMGVAWNSWIRDLIPDGTRGTFFGRRVRWMTAIGMVVVLTAGVLIDHWPSLGLGDVRNGYAALFVCAVIFGLGSIAALARVKEPPMAPPAGPVALTAMLRQPFRDTNFRNLMFFLAAWNFAINLAAPFFTVHMYERLELSVFTVTALASTSLVANILVLSTVGTLVDRFSGKSVLAVSAPLFLVCIFAWVFTARPESETLQLALLAVIHVCTGIATAGVTIASTTIAMRLAPVKDTTAFLTANGLMASAAAGIAPIIGGLTADALADKKLSLIVHWETAQRDLALETLKVEHWDFFFVMAAVIGLYSLHRLTMVREDGSVSERVVLTEFMAETKRTIQNISTVAGLRALTEWPFAIVQRRVLRRRGRGKGDKPG
ncbi:MAG: MFS transporter [Rhodospirillales bacterium]